MEYGRIEGGKRLKAPKPAGSWERFSIIGAISLIGIVAIMYGKWATDTLTFITFIKECLLNKLKKGQVVFLDNANIHQSNVIKELIESVGAKMIFLPPYSPDLSPIEKMWSKIKHYISKKSPRDGGEFHNALIYAISELNDEDFEEWFEACGYQFSR